MAEKQNKATGGTSPEDERAAFRRAAALHILGAYVSRHGGFQPEAMDAMMRVVWQYADTFVALEDAPPLPPVEAPPPPARPARRRAHPSDEWQVRDGDRVKKGFVSYEEAEWYATNRPGAVIEQVSGPEALVADPGAV